MTSDSYVEADNAAEPEGEGWALRPLMLALIGLATGYGTHLIIGTDYSHAPSVMQMTQLTALLVGAGLFGLTVERRHVPAAAIFALVCAAVAAGIMWWNGNPDHWGGGDGWRVFSLAMALAIAAPLFQAWRDREETVFDYSAVHDHAWTNIVLWVACWVFVGITWALAWLLASLFKLIELNFLEKLLMEEWFARCLIGLAFGAGLGLLREHDFVVRLLQRVVTTVLAVLAPVLAVGLVVFLLALPFTGLAPLWKAGSATAILLVCSVGAFILANAVIGSTPEQMRRFPVLRYGAMALGVVITPLAIIAAVAIGLRIGQYGYTPERLWALTFVVVAMTVGVAYLVALARGRMGWAEYVRPSNLHLAFLLCLIALVLATPLISFNAISTHDQVARLESGKLTPEKFDWQALAFDFGEPGKQALKRLTSSPNAAIRTKAVEVAKAERKWDIPSTAETERVASIDERLRILPQGTALPEEIRAMIARTYSCGREDRCTLIFLPGGKEALLFEDGCFAPPAPAPAAPPASEADKATVMVENVTAEMSCRYTMPSRYVLTGDKWGEASTAARTIADAEAAKADAGYKAGQIEVRPVTRRQAFVGGVPVGDAFE